jgi:hypothetical protein
MRVIGSFDSKRWGRVTAMAGTYRAANGPLAVALLDSDGEPLANLSVNIVCSSTCPRDSRDLPDGHFYAKTWSENRELAAEALRSGLFLARPDLPAADTGYVTAPVWQIAPPPPAPAGDGGVTRQAAEGVTP